MRRFSKITVVMLMMVMIFGTFGTAYASTIQNEKVSVNISDGNGTYNFGLRPTDSTGWYNISYAWPSSPGTSFTTVRIDGTNNIYGSNGFTTAPRNINNLMNESIARFGDVSVRQVLDIVYNPATGIRDVAEIRYVLTNTGTIQHSVGLRIMIDTMLKGNDSSPFKIPTASGMVSTNQEQNYLANNVPDFWQGFYNLDNPDISAQWTLRGGDAVVPDRLAIASWGSIAGTQWDYTTTPGRYTGDSAVGMWWNEQSIAPGQTRTIVTYYGMPTVGGSSKLTVSCPTQLPHDEWSQRPFNVVAYINNNTQTSFENVFATIETPLNIVDNDASHSIGTIPSNGSNQTSWRVQPSAPGRYTVRVNVFHTVNGTPELIDTFETQIEALAPVVPENIQVTGSSGTTANGTPVSGRMSPMTVRATFETQPISVELVATDGNGDTYRAEMSLDNTTWLHTFTPNRVGLWESPMTILIIPHYADGTTGPPQQFPVQLIDPSGFIYNVNQGEDWRLPGATVTLKYFDPELNAWVDMSNEAYPGRMSPINNPQTTNADGRYAWDVAAGQYKIFVSRPGFATAESESKTIPPPVTDLNVGLIPTDIVKPVVDITGVNNGANYTNPVSIQLNASDDEAGLRSFSYSLDGALEVEENDGSDSINVSIEGSHTLSYKAYDYAGNILEGSLNFTIGNTNIPAFQWVGLLDNAASVLGLDQNNDIAFKYNLSPNVDKTVSVRIRNNGTNKLIVGYTFGAGITYDEAGKVYHQIFKPATYRISSGTQLKVMIYLGGKLIDSKVVNTN